jgi:hypothetical protein
VPIPHPHPFGDEKNTKKFCRKETSTEREQMGIISKWKTLANMVIMELHYTIQQHNMA